MVNVANFLEIAPIVNVVQVVLLTFLFRHAINKLDINNAKKNFLTLTVAVLLFAWLFTAAVISQTGFFQQLTSYIPNIGLIFVPIAIGLTLLQSSETVKKIVTNLWIPGLITVQVFRLLGVYFLIYHAQGLMPAEFAFPSGYGDIIIGLTAPIVGYIYYLKKPYAKKLAIVWNYVGILDLVIAIVTGFFTSPTSYQLLAHSLPNELLFAYPLALVPTFAVPLAILLHIFALKALNSEKKSLNARFLN